MAYKTFVVEITVHSVVSEAAFGNAMVKGLQDGDIHHLSYLTHHITDIEVRPYEEPDREWNVMLVKKGNEFQSEWGYRGKEDQILDATHAAHPGCSIIGWFPKPE